MTYFVVQVVILKKGNSSQFSLMSFMYIVTLSGKESLQLFRVVIVIFLEERKCYCYRDYYLVRVCDENL